MFKYFFASPRSVIAYVRTAGAESEALALNPTHPGASTNKTVEENDVGTSKSRGIH